MLATFVIMTLATFDKEATIQADVQPTLKRLVKAAHVEFPPQQIMFRVFKDERSLEVWGASKPGTRLKLIKQYSIRAASGTLGPKVRRGDMQVPEGWYFVNRFNPKSAYHLSLGINYPNEVDRERSTLLDPGNDIFIHGNRVSAGCLAMGDPAIEEIYSMAKLAKGRTYILILPSRNLPNSEPNHRLYQDLFAIDSRFEREHRVPKILVSRNGYRVK
jgi:murein L,D-transpeptidase YafK